MFAALVYNYSLGEAVHFGSIDVGVQCISLVESLWPVSAA